jgi:hypothetical protein
MSNLLTNNLFDVMNEVQDLQRVETPGACLTLTRSSTLAITTASTTITWQVETRNNGFTWSGTDITIPTTGFYCMSLTYNANTSHTAYMRLIINSNNVIHMTGDNVGSTTRHGYMWMRYFTTDDVLNFTVVPSTNVTIQVNAEGTVSESPFFHIVQMTGSLT